MNDALKLCDDLIRARVFRGHQWRSR